MSIHSIKSLSALAGRGQSAAALTPAAQPAAADHGVSLDLDLDLDLFAGGSPSEAEAAPEDDGSAPGGRLENGSGTGSAVVAASGNQGIDGLLSGVRWAGGSITYSFPDSAADYQAGYPEAFTNAHQLNAAQQLATHFALNAATYTQPAAATGFSVEGMTGLDINWTSNQAAGTIRLINTDDPNTAYVVDYPGTSIWDGDAFFGPSGRTPVMGNYHWYTVLHEMGHSLGLKHGHQTDTYGAMPSYIDSMEFSLMTYRSYIGAPTDFVYNEEFGFAQTFMMYDIAALQYMYGADFTTNSGDTTYSWTPSNGNTVIDGSAAITPGANRIFMTIWDGGGVDTYDASAYTTGVSIDLAPGGHSLLSGTQRAHLGNGNYARGNVFNALQYNGDARSLIENATGGSGGDTLYGNAANNLLTGNAGNDYLWSSSGDDALYGGDGADTVSGSSGNDWASGDGGNDYVYGGSGNDAVFGGEGTDTMYGGDGDDWLYAGEGGTIDAVNDGGAGTDGLYYGYFGLNGYTFDHGANEIRRGAAVLGTMAGIEVLYGGYGNDIIISDGGSHTYYGIGGDDRMYAGIGGETMYGGTGIDTADMTLFDGDYLYDMGTGLTNYGAELYLEFERVVMGDGNDTVIGTAGAETIDGGLGNDSMEGLAGNDQYHVNSTSDLVVEAVGGGIDWVVSTVNLTLGANVENLQLRGGALAGTGNGLSNLINGTSGANTLHGGVGGVDTLRGYTGNDLYMVGTGDIVIEAAGEGTDTVRSWVDHIMAANIENLGLTGGAAIDGTGNGLNNAMNGNGNDNVLNGFGGNDSIWGNGGDDVLNGNAGNDILMGNNGADVLNGGGGNDQLDGGINADELTGNAGADRFIYRAGSDGDIVTDFVDNVDKLLLDFPLTIKQALAMASVIAGDVVFNFGDGDTLIVENINDKNLLANDIIMI